ncbi:DUF4350 domain-containing protein [Aquimarina sp. U1-2]|nr:DUF4350 domain-containing protein [Aquimarina sp. U1-2]
MAKLLIVLFVIAVGVVTFLEANEPEPINWFPSYAKVDKIPLGTFVVYNSIKEGIDDDNLKEINSPPYEFLFDNDTVSGTYIFVNETITFGEDELYKLLAWVARGNTLFISSKTMEPKLLDTLKLNSDYLLSLDRMSTKPMVALSNTSLAGKTPFLYDRDISNSYFSAVDTCYTKALGVAQLYNDTLKITTPHINYIKQGFGTGYIFLHMFPEAFGNYFMLKDQNFQYTQNVLAYILPSEKILWDNYYKNGKTFYTSPLYLLLNNRYLKWAYYVVLIGVVLFVLFEGKRKQRSIPILSPLKNQTLAFTRTISGMYFEKQKHKEIATKQYLLFLDYVRQTLRIPTDNLDEKTLIDIAARSNNDLRTTKALFKYFNELYKKQTIEKEELMKLYHLITNFKNRV